MLQCLALTTKRTLAIVQADPKSHDDYAHTQYSEICIDFAEVIAVDLPLVNIAEANVK